MIGHCREYTRDYFHKNDRLTNISTLYLVSKSQKLEWKSAIFVLTSPYRMDYGFCRLREYLNFVIVTIRHEYLMSFFMNSYTLWPIQLARSSTSLLSSYNGGIRCNVVYSLAPLQPHQDGKCSFLDHGCHISDRIGTLQGC